MVLKLIRDKQLTNEKLFEEIYREHFKKVKFFAYGYLYDHEKAENIAQDVFLALWGQMENLDKNGEILPFLLVMAKYRCLNWLRREKYHEKFKKKVVSDYDISITALSEESSTSLYYSEIENLIYTAIEKMPDKVKGTFVLSRFKNFKNREIAQLQNISEKTVEYRMSLAFKVLRKSLKDYVYLILLFASKIFW